MCFSANIQGDLGSTAKWWAAWRSFMFDSSVTVKARKGGGIETKAVRKKKRLMYILGHGRSVCAHTA
jgi:hypothetical protein